MKITIPKKTPTINHLYGQNGVRKFLKPEARKLREEIFDIVLNHTLHDPIKEPPIRLQVHVKVYEDWYCKNGNVKRKDVANREKFLIDSVFNALGIDDKMIFKHTMEKIQSESEKCEIIIEAYNDK